MPDIRESVIRKIETEGTILWVSGEDFKFALQKEAETMISIDSPIIIAYDGRGRDPENVLFALNHEGKFLPFWS